MTRRGFDKAAHVFGELKAQDPSFAPSEVELNAWGYKLAGKNAMPQALAVLNLNAALHAGSWNVYDSLGEIHEQAGDKRAATDNFEKSLALNPHNANATNHLARLGKANK